MAQSLSPLVHLFSFSVGGRGFFAVGYFSGIAGTCIRQWSSSGASRMTRLGGFGGFGEFIEDKEWTY
jgi:hypothetical protein